MRSCSVLRQLPLWFFVPGIPGHGALGPKRRAAPSPSLIAIRTARNESLSGCLRPIRAPTGSQDLAGAPPTLRERERR